MAEKNALTQSTLITFTVMSNGSEIPGQYHCVAMRISSTTNKIAYARLEYLDGGESEENEFSLSNEGLFDPGKEITIKVGYENEEKIIFKGIVIKQNLTVDAAGESYIVVECRDIAVKMTVGRKNSVFYEKADSDIIKEVAQKAGLKVNIEDTGTVHKELIQHSATDWDFMLLRAEINGMFVNTVDGEINIGKPSLSDSPALTVDYGTGFISFNGEMDVRSQYKSVVYQSWDMATQKLIDVKGEAVGEVEQGELSSDKLADVLGLDEYVVHSPTNMSEAVLKKWADARASRSRLSKIKGTMTIRGNANVLAGSVIEIEGLSNHFNGKAFVSGVTHVVEEGNWVTEVQMGVSNESYAEEVSQIEPPAAAGGIPAIAGLHIGIVKKIHEDPEGNYRVQVAIPTLKKDNMPVWARLTNFYSSNEAGVFFYPEINDEVIVGFLNDDPQSPIVLGSVYSKALKPKYMPEEPNGIKSIFTKGELEIQFNDTDKILTIHTPEKNTVILDDKNKTITIEDTPNKNKMVMSSEGISLESEKDIKLTAKGKIILQSTSNTEITATGDLLGEGMNVTMKGKTKFAAEGTQAELKGSATTTVKGAIVQIN